MSKLKRSKVKEEQYEILNLDAFPIDKIFIEKNIRESYDQNELAEFANSIETNGQLQPIGISNKAEPNGKYKLIYGHRRFLAIKDILKATTIKVTYVSNYKNRTQIQLIENIQRTDLTDLEIAKALTALKQETKETNSQLSKRLNKSEKWIKDKIVYFGIVDNLKKDAGVPFENLDQSTIMETRSLNPEQQKEILEEALKDNLTKSQVREKVKTKKDAGVPFEENKNAELFSTPNQPERKITLKTIRDDMEDNRKLHIRIKIDRLKDSYTSHKTKMQTVKKLIEENKGKLVFDMLEHISKSKKLEDQYQLIEFAIRILEQEIKCVYDW